LLWRQGTLEQSVSSLVLNIYEDDKVIEISCVGTMRPMRRKGLMSHLFKEIFKQYEGYTFILDANDRKVASLYARLGFKIDEGHEDDEDDIPMTRA
jgi:GNAT superfamily N-acetyltransferase